MYRPLAQNKMRLYTAIRLFHTPPSLNIRHWFLDQIEALRVRKHGGIRGE